MMLLVSRCNLTTRGFRSRCFADMRWGREVHSNQSPLNQQLPRTHNDAAQRSDGKGRGYFVQCFHWRPLEASHWAGEAVSQYWLVNERKGE